MIIISHNLIIISSFLKHRWSFFTVGNSDKPPGGPRSGHRLAWESGEYLSGGLLLGALARLPAVGKLRPLGKLLKIPTWGNPWNKKKGLGPYQPSFYGYIYIELYLKHPSPLRIIFVILTNLNVSHWISTRKMAWRGKKAGNGSDD